MTKCWKYLKEKYNSNEPLKIEWIIAILLAFVMLITFAYMDLKSFTAWSTDVFDSIADSSILDFFKVSAENVHGSYHGGASGILFYMIPWSIWNLPIWVAQRFFHYEVTVTSLSLIWSKLFLVFSLIITLMYTHKTIMLLTKDKIKAKWGVFLSFSFVFTYIGVFYAGQTDILTTMLGIMAIYYLLSKKNKIFYILSGFAISIKYFFFLPYIFIILLTEKNIGKAIGKILIGLIPSVVFYLLCYNLPMYLGSGADQVPMIDIFEQIINPTFPILREQTLSLLIAALLIFAFIVYKTIPKNETEKNKLIIYFVTASYIIFFALGYHEFYRMILIMPYIYILFMQNDKILGYNVLLDTIINIFYVVVLSCSSRVFFASNWSMKYTLTNNILQLDNFHNKVSPFGFLEFHMKDQMELIGTISASIIFACMLIVLFINYPRNKIKFDFEKREFERYLIWIRMLILVPILIYLIHGTIN